MAASSSDGLRGRAAAAVAPITVRSTISVAHCAAAHRSQSHFIHLKKKYGMIAAMSISSSASG